MIVINIYIWFLWSTQNKNKNISVTFLVIKNYDEQYISFSQYIPYRI